MRKLLLLLIIILSFHVYAVDMEKKITLNINTTLEKSFEIISKVSDLNFFIDENVPSNKNIKLKFENMKLEDVMNILMKLYNLDMEFVTENSVIIFPKVKEAQYKKSEVEMFRINYADIRELGSLIGTMLGQRKVTINMESNSLIINGSKKDIEKAREVIQEYDKSEDYGEKTYYLSHLDPEKFIASATKLVKIDKFLIDKALNSITISGSKLEIDKIDKIIEDLDIMPPQVMIEITLLDASDNLTKKFGINWQDTMNMTLDSFNSTSLKQLIVPESISMSDIDSSADILSNPTIRVINNELAKINIGERVAIVIAKPTGVQSEQDKISTAPSVEYKDVGIQMEVTPVVHRDDYITIKLNLEVSSLGEKSTQTEYGDYPTFVTKNINTNVRLKNNETVIFGGLISNEERNKRVKVPFLGDIPVFGKVFSSNEKIPRKSEIVMMIKPTVISNIEGYKVTEEEEIKKVVEKFDIVNRGDK